MIKRVIFDVDNTLIEWKDEYDYEVNKALDEMNIKYNDVEVKNLYKAIMSYEEDNYIFNIDKMWEFVKSYTKKQYPKELLIKIIEKWGNCTENQASDELIDVLQYLKNKYEMVTLTDWYLKPQVNRLKRLGIDKFFSEMYGAENFRRKPFPDGFLKAKGNHLPEECVLIGDNLERDIEGAVNVGINAIWYSPKNKDIRVNEKLDIYCENNEDIKLVRNIDKNSNTELKFKIIHNLVQLKEIL